MDKIHMLSKWNLILLTMPDSNCQYHVFITQYVCFNLHQMFHVKLFCFWNCSNNPLSGFMSWNKTVVWHEWGKRQSKTVFFFVMLPQNYKFKNQKQKKIKNKSITLPTLVLNTSIVVLKPFFTPWPQQLKTIIVFKFKGKTAKSSSAKLHTFNSVVLFNVKLLPVATHVSLT